jgi:tRNA(Ile)-lysidine synthase
MVGRVATDHGFPHAILDWSRPVGAAGGLQAQARHARYDLMAGYCHAPGIEALVTAHHLDDQAETFLMRLKRGSGLDGLAAIPERGEWAGIVLLRPLLGVSKARLAATLAEAGLEFAVDPSNADRRFERVRMRASQDAFTQLGLTPEALARSALRLRRAREALDAAAAEFLTRHAAVSEAGYILIQRQRLADAAAEIALRVLDRSISAVGGISNPIRLAKLEALLASLQSDPRKTRTLGGCRLVPLGEKLGVFRETRGAGLPILPLAPGERALWDNRFRVELGPLERDPVTVRALGEAGWRHLSPCAPLLAALPRQAGATLPSCWRGDELLFLPRFDDPAEGSFRAHFVSGEARPRGAGR